MGLASERGEEHAALLRLAAGGFRDMTRIASGHPRIWLDICDENRTAILSALDGKQYAKGGGGDPAFNIARVRRDLGSQSTIGMLLADREDGNRFNRVGNLDVRYVFGGLYYAQLQYAGSLTDTSAGARYGRMWEGVVDRTGREFGFHYSLKGFSPDFVTQTGFVSRTNIVDVSAMDATGVRE